MNTTLHHIGYRVLPVWQSGKFMMVSTSGPEFESRRVTGKDFFGREEISANVPIRSQIPQEGTVPAQCPPSLVYPQIGWGGV